MVLNRTSLVGVFTPEFVAMAKPSPQSGMVAKGEIFDPNISGATWTPGVGTTVTKTHSAWKYGHLIWLGVDPDIQGHGIASKLFHRFRDIMVEEGVRMLVVDSEADNLPALYFFRKMGFGSPQEHIYLALNLDPQLRQFREKKVNERSTSRYKVEDDE